MPPSLAPSPDDKIPASISLCGGAFGALKFPTEKMSLQCRIFNNSRIDATLVPAEPPLYPPQARSAIANGAALSLLSSPLWEGSGVGVEGWSKTVPPRGATHHPGPPPQPKPGYTRVSVTR